MNNDNDLVMCEQAAEIRKLKRQLTEALSQRDYYRAAANEGYFIKRLCEMDDEEIERAGIEPEGGQ